MELEFQNIHRSLFSFVYTPLGEGDGLSVSDYDGVSLAARGTGYATDFLRVGLATSGFSKTYFFEMSLAEKKWKRVDIPFKAFRSADLLDQISPTAKIAALIFSIKSRERELRIFVDDVKIAKFGDVTAPAYETTGRPNPVLTPSKYFSKPKDWPGFPELAEALKTGKPVRIAVLGDSSVLGGELWNWGEARSKYAWPSALGQRLAETFNNEKISTEVYSSVKDTLRDDAEHRIRLQMFFRELKSDSNAPPARPKPAPDLAVISYGRSDAKSGETTPEEFAKLLSGVAQLLKQRGVKAMIIATPAPVVGNPDMTKDYAEAARKVAGQEGVPCADVFAAFYRGDDEVVRKAYCGEYMATADEPNLRGHQAIADIIMEGLSGIGRATPQKGE